MQAGDLGVRKEVQGVTQQGPALPAGRKEADVVQGHPTSPPRSADLAAQEPSRAESTLRANDLDVLTPGALQVAIELVAEAGGASHRAPGHVHCRARHSTSR